LKIKIILLALGILICGPTLAHNGQATQKNAQISALTFTNTQTWSPRYLEWALNAKDIPGVALPNAPKNTSKTTKKDLAVIHTFQNERTQENIVEINREIYIDNAFFGEKTFAELVDETHRPQTSILIEAMTELESPQIMRQKKLYDRVRPSYLDPTIKPIIDVPLHPAYPSGHATQAQLRALVLSELDPKNRAAYLQAAKRIARNREIAGLHYPSDSRAGVILAGQLFKKLMKNPDFVERLEKAKTEWVQ
jgi:hypothetical protein